MKIVKSFLCVVSADILALFINLTLAGSSNPLLRAVCALCTSLILVCLVGSFAMKTAENDLRNERITKKITNPLVTFFTGIMASLPSLVSWLILKFSDTDFYALHKVINGYFLQIYNFINSDAKSDSLTAVQIYMMFPLVFVPALSFFTPYLLVYKGVISSKE